jgi:O-methyltransferase involved in polyketide biosynthesis
VVEVDQPGVVAVKSQLLHKRGRPGGNFRLVAHDLAHESGGALLKKIAPHVKPDVPTVIIAEGLTGYLNEEALRGVLQTLGILLGHFSDARLIIDFYEKLTPVRHKRVFWAMLPPRLIWKIMRASMAMFLTDEAHVRELLISEGFTIQKMYTAGELATMAGRKPPPLNLFYVTVTTLSALADGI